MRHSSTSIFSNWQLRLASGVLFVCVGVGGVGACGDGSSGNLASFTLGNNPFVKLPRAQARAIGDAVTISTTLAAGQDGSQGFEALAPGYVYHAWAGAPSALSDLGVFQAGVDKTGNAPNAAVAMITIESSGGESTTPSESIVVSGSVGSDLTFGTLSALAFSNARAAVEMGHDWMQMSYSGLPGLPHGYHYELWLVVAVVSGGSAPDSLRAGVLTDLPAGKMPRYSNSNLPEQFELRVTIEANAGADTISPIVCLKLQHDHEQHQH